MKKLLFILLFPLVLYSSDLTLPLKDSEVKVRMENAILRIQLLQDQMNKQQEILISLKPKAFEIMELDEKFYEFNFNTLSFDKK